MNKKKLPLILGGVAAVAVAVGGAVWWQDKQRWEKTENAYVQADTIQVSPQIDGYVAEVLVTDNQRVASGQVLLRLDDSEARAKLAQAEANYAALLAAADNVDARRELEGSQIAERAATVTSAEAQARLARLELDRYGKLADQGWVSDQRLQTVRANADQASAGVAQARAALQAQQRDAATLSSVKAQTMAQAAQARAAVEQARIALDRTVIRAPAGGVVGARAVRPGQYVRPGVQLLSVVPLGRTYIVANFKETQVGELKVGQRVEIATDAFKGRPIQGRIDSFSPATGSEFALIPIENATGNFTKIVQRVPVKIAVDERAPLAGALRPGLSVEVKVDLKSGGGATFAEAAAAEVRLAQSGAVARP